MERCFFCGRLSSPGPICSFCLLSLDQWRVRLKPCTLCGRLLDVEEAEALCPQCQKSKPPFRLARAVGPYGGLLKDKIWEFKYLGRRSLYSPLAYLMARTVASEPLFGKPEIVLPVPLSAEKLKQRAFNQTELLAREVGRLLGLKVALKLLFKTKDTPPQTGLSRSARMYNLKDSFGVGAVSALRGLDVLLVDDVLTTGATAAACTSVLLQAGAASVSVITVATATFG